MKPGSRHDYKHPTICNNLNSPPSTIVVCGGDNTCMSKPVVARQRKADSLTNVTCSHDTAVGKSADLKSCAHILSLTIEAWRVCFTQSWDCYHCDPVSFVGVISNTILFQSKGYSGALCRSIEYSVLVLCIVGAPFQSQNMSLKILKSIIIYSKHK